MYQEPKALPYVLKDPSSIYSYAKNLENKTLREITNLKSLKDIRNKKDKGSFGTLLEEYYFKYKANSDRNADFVDAGLELKSTPLKRTSKGLRAKERLLFSIINYMDIIAENWDNSSFLKKNKLILLIFYLFEENKEILDYLIKYVSKWSILDNDAEIIKRDWETIVKKIRDGKAHEISEADTFYLAACTKGAGKGRDLRSQPNSDIKAKQRAFSFKPKYVNLMIEKISGNYDEDVQDVVSVQDLRKKDFSDIIEDRLKHFQGKTFKEICKELGTDSDFGGKSKYALLAAQMLGAKKGRKVAEFEKAEIEVKSIRLNKKGTPKESMSFPYFGYKKLIQDDWDDSLIREQFEKKFFFMIFQEDENKVLRFKKGMFYNLPYSDLIEVQRLWNQVRNGIKNGIYGNTPQDENRVSHIRPHGKDSHDTIETPSGTKEVKRCFWLNASYLKNVIENG